MMSNVTRTMRFCVSVYDIVLDVRVDMHYIMHNVCTQDPRNHVCLVRIHHLDLHLVVVHKYASCSHRSRLDLVHDRLYMCSRDRSRRTCNLVEN